MRFWDFEREICCVVLALILVSKCFLPKRGWRQSSVVHNLDQLVSRSATVQRVVVKRSLGS
jgi:hypothetical protein